MVHRLLARSASARLFQSTGLLFSLAWMACGALGACTTIEPVDEEEPGGDGDGEMADGGGPMSGVGGASSGGNGSGGAQDGSGGAGSGGAPAVPGFTADYFWMYRDRVHSQVESVIDHVWEGESEEPYEGVGTDRFSARYTATLHVPTTGSYTFATNADDGVRLWVDEQLVIDDWRAHVAERHEGSIELGAGDVELTLEYFEANFGASLSLSWTRPNEMEQLLDDSFVSARPGSEVAPKPDYRNAVLPSSCPDPGVLKDGTPPTYYMVCTGGSFGIRRSYDLVLWESTGQSVIPAGKPAWAANGSRNWAPEMHRVGDKYVVYYTSVNGENVLSIGATSSDSPLGPYTDRGSPLVEHAQGVIDSHYFRDTDGKHYLTYKIDGNSVGQPTPIYIRELAPDGMSFAEGSSQVEILTNQSATWEGGVVEAQWLIERDGTYFLFYSGNVYDHRYRTGVARAQNVLGPYTKHGDPILTNNDDWVGPGHGSVIPVGDDFYFIYHAWPENGAGQHASDEGRHVLLDKINFEDNWPVIADGSPSTTVQPRPAE